MGLGSFLGMLGGAIAAPFTGGASLIGPIAQGIGNFGAGASQGRAEGRAQESDILLRQDELDTRRYQIEQQAKTAMAEMVQRGIISQGQMDAALQEFNAEAGNRRAEFNTLTQNQGDQFNVNADLERRRFNLDANEQRRATGAKGALMANMQDATIPGLPRGVPRHEVQGGLRPSAFGPGGRALGQQTLQNALEGQRANDPFDPLTPPTLAGPAERASRTELSPIDLGQFTSVAPQGRELPQSGKLDTFLNLLGYGGAAVGTAADIARQAGRHAGRSGIESTPPIAGVAGMQPPGTNIGMPLGPFLLNAQQPPQAPFFGF